MVTYHIPTKANPNPTLEPKQTVPEGANIIALNAADTMNNIFCFAALTDKQKGTLHTDATRTLTVISMDGYQYFFVAYDYDTN